MLLLHQVLFWSQYPSVPWRKSPLAPSSEVLSLGVQAGPLGRIHLPLLTMCSLGLALGSPAPIPGWGLSQPGTRSGVERACHAARKNFKLGFAVISYENKAKLSRLFTGWKTSPHWGLLCLESQWLNSQMFLTPQGYRWPLVPAWLRSLWCRQAPGLPWDLRSLLLAEVENNWYSPSVVIIWTLHHPLCWVSFT